MRRAVMVESVFVDSPSRIHNHHPTSRQKRRKKNKKGKSHTAQVNKSRDAARKITNQQIEACTGGEGGKGGRGEGERRETKRGEK